MNLVILFEKIGLSDIKEDKDIFCDQLRVIAMKSLMPMKDKNENIEVQLLEGKSPNIPEEAKVAVFILLNQTMPNMGKYIVEFKQKAIEIFERADIRLDMNMLFVKLSNPKDVDALIKNLDERINQDNMKKEYNEFDYEQKSKQYIPVEPEYSFDRVILPQDVLEKIEEAIGILEYENKVFQEWGLYEIQPHPSTALNFYGPSGTGKTMAAEAVANKLGKKILKTSYADVESKYHGEGPKMIKAIFLAAKNNDAVLFFDEADSLLSKRLTSVSQGSEQAINSMRSQLLICLEEFRGIVIFATNLVINYDQAFLTRLISVEFKNPDVEVMKTIWNVHIKPLEDGKSHKLNIPLSEDVDIQALAEEYDFVGREIRNAVISACVSTAMTKRNVVTQADFIKACNKILEEKKALAKAKDHTKGTDMIKKAIQEKIEKMEGEKQDVFEQAK